MPYGQLIKIEDGKIIRDFLDDEQQPGSKINSGRLDGEKDQSISNWQDVASIVDEDELAFTEEVNGRFKFINVLTNKVKLIFFVSLASLA